MKLLERLLGLHPSQSVPAQVKASQDIMSRKVFIMGSPRSGTTALTRLLMSHPDVLLADPDVLDVRFHPNPTYESGIFVRLADDEEIRDKFAAIDGRKPIILEKTPTHILHYKRVRRVFPDAKFIFTLRDASDVMRSIKVAKNTWMKNAPDFEEFCRIWAQSTSIILECQTDHDVLVLPYADIVGDVEKMAQRVFDFTGLDKASIGHCVSLMTDQSTERITGIVGESIRGGQTRLDHREQEALERICGDVQASLDDHLRSI